MKHNNNRAFTLLELLIAVAISAFIVVGVYTLLNSIISSNSALSNKYQESLFYNKLSILFNEDYRQSINNSLQVISEPLEDYNTKKIEFTTTNSIFFNRALPVNVSYYVEDNYLVREENLPEMSYDFKLRLIDNVSYINILYYNSFDNKFQEEKPSGDILIFKIIIKWNNNEYNFIVGKFAKK